MKLKQFFCVFLCITLLLACLSFNSFAANAICLLDVANDSKWDINTSAILEGNDLQGWIIANGPDLFDPARISEVEKTNRIIDSYVSNKLSLISNAKNTSSRYLSVPLYQQSNSYYCGPASVQMTLKYLTGTKYSQSTLASNMGTSSSNGTYVYQIKNCLNSYAGAGMYQYVLTTESSLDSSLIYSIDAGKPIIAHVMTGTLPNYNGSSNTGHYIVLSGYSMVAGAGSVQYTCTYKDPHYNNNYYGTYSCSVSTMRTAINNNAGYYIRGT